MNLRTFSVSLTNGWNGGHNFTKLQFVQDSCFSGSIEPNCGRKVSTFDQPVQRKTEIGLIAALPKDPDTAHKMSTQ